MNDSAQDGVVTRIVPEFPRGTTVTIPMQIADIRHLDRRPEPDQHRNQPTAKPTYAMNPILPLSTERRNSMRLPHHNSVLLSIVDFKWQEFYP